MEEVYTCRRERRGEEEEVKGGGMEEVGRRGGGEDVKSGEMEEG